MTTFRTHVILFSSCTLALAASAGCGTDGDATGTSGTVQETTTGASTGVGGSGGVGGTGGSGGVGGTGGSGGGCTTDADCPAANEPCVVATCQPDGTCAPVNAPLGLALPSDQQVPHDCKVVACDGSGAATELPDDADVEDDGEICTIDQCSAGVPVHAPAAADTDCSAEGPAPAKVCGDPGGPNAGKCVECNDTSGDAQCPSHVCQMNACAAPSCMDGAQNGEETGVDCGGGTCQKCGAGQGCGSGADCESGICTTNVCQASSCMDGVKNGVETDIDCGGGACPACGTNAECTTNADCATGTCNNGICNTTSCTIPLSFTVPGCTDVAALKPATANGAYPGYPITGANDGVCDTAWNAGGYSGYWQVDLGSTQPIRGASVAVAGTPATTVNITISTSVDGAMFTDAFSTTVPDPAVVTAYAFDFGSSADARYVRFSLSSPASWVDLVETSVWNCP